MIERYSRKEMAYIWEPENKFRIWLKIEVFAAEAMFKLGIVPADAMRKIKKKANFNLERIAEIEETVKHDVIAFLHSVGEHIGSESAYLHLGLTSSDILDTSLAAQLVQATDILIDDVNKIIDRLEAMAREFRELPAMGRTHGIHAEPVTLGLKFLSWFEEMKRNRKRLKEARSEISYGKLSGAVGTFANVDPFVEKYVMKKLGLKPEPVSTQVVPRDRHARYFSTLAVVASSIERFAVEIRHLQKTEVQEVEEYFSEGQKGSSAMPHKKNPILTENLAGLARLLRSYSVASMESVALWHERDISHSSVERVISPDATILLDFMLNRFLGVLNTLVVNESNIMENMRKSYNLFYSQRLLVELSKKGMPREKAYEIVQNKAMKAWKERKDFRSIVRKSSDIKKIMSNDELDSLFDITYYFRNINTIYQRSLGKEAKRGKH